MSAPVFCSIARSLETNTSSNAALLLQSGLRQLSHSFGRSIQDRIGIHIGEVVIEVHDGTEKTKDLYGIQVDTAARIQSLAEGSQILLSRSTFDNARQVLKGQDIAGIGAITWLNHGPYLLKGVEDPLEICEVGEVEPAPLKPPPDYAILINLTPANGGRRSVGVSIIPTTYPNTLYHPKGVLATNGNALRVNRARQSVPFHQPL